GTALFVSGAAGLRAEGIELLPIGQKIIATKQLIDWDLKPGDVELLSHSADQEPWLQATQSRAINELRITKNAYPRDTGIAMGKYLAAPEAQNDRVREVLLFAVLCILESISYTRKDGQYLRWDYRSGRRQGKKIFNKGVILTFDRAISEKLQEIVTDLHAGDMPEDLFGTIRTRTE